jgi:energy-coupling factor transporter ATP-binding protein EcfA2
MDNKTYTNTNDSKNINNLIFKLKNLFISDDVQNITSTFNKEVEKKYNNNLQDNKNNITDSYFKNIGFSKSIYDDMEFFPNVYSKINYTFTKRGNEKLKKLLVSPISNIEQLNKNKEHLMKLFSGLTIQIGRDSPNFNNKKISLNSINEKFNLLKNCEEDVYWILKKIKDNDDQNKVENVDRNINSENSNFSTLTDMLYFKNNIPYYSFIEKYTKKNGIHEKCNINNHPNLLYLKNMYKIYLSPIMCFITPIIYFITPFIILKFKFGIKLPFSFYKNIIINYYVKGFFKNFKLKDVSITSMIILIWYILSTILFIVNIINTIEISKLINKVKNLIHSKMISLNKFITTFTEIEPFFSHINYLDYPFQNNKNILIISKFIKDIKDDTFSNFGSSLYFFNKLLTNREYKTEVENFLEIVSYIDMQYSLYLLYSYNNLSYSSYIEEHINKDKQSSPSPFIFLSQFYHPTLNSHEAIKNDVELTNYSNMLITGPNAGGKSTLMKSIGINIILAQTICIGFFNSMILTPFTYISTQMNHTSIDTCGYESLFQAEMNHIVKNITNVQKLYNHNITYKNVSNKYSLLLLDELFNSTNSIEGVSGSYGICKKLSNYSTNITILATHFSKLCKLEKECKFVNYKMNVKIIKDDKDIKDIIFPYKITKGISTQYIALELLKKKLKTTNDNDIYSEIINNALLFKKNISSKNKNKLLQKREK